MAFEDYFAPATTGTLSGAGMGAAMGGPIGAGIGAGVGLIGGLFQGSANSKNRRAMEDARRQTLELARQQRAQRMSDLQAALKYFQPVNDRLNRLYGPGAVPPQFQPPPRQF